MFKKIYIEITNQCNLSCPFCIQNQRPPKFLTEKEWQIILEKIKPYTKYLYLHILGEPLLHPKINQFIHVASQDFWINITTNGYFIKKIKENTKIRQINISLHSFHPQYQKSLDEYLKDIFDAIEVLKKHTYISLRIWVKNEYTKEIIHKINEHFHKEIDINHIQNETHIDHHVFLNTHEEFIWPQENKDSDITGPCYALKDHIGILSDGTVVPCCLDAQGSIRLGNIFHYSLENIIHSSRYQKMKKGFQENKRIERLCQSCNFHHKKVPLK